MTHHSCEHLPLKPLLTTHGFDVALEPREPCSNGFLRCRGITTVQPAFERFHEQFRARPPGSTGNTIQSGTELLGQKELMPDFLRLHVNLTIEEMPSVVV